MRISYRELPAAMVLLATAGACQSPSEIDKLTISSKCNTPPKQVGTLLPNYHTAMTTNNDGGWCWADVTQTRPAQPLYLSSAYVTVSTPPNHGRIKIGAMPDFRIRIAYQPDDGFIGNDSFIVHYGVLNKDLIYKVTVTE